MEEKTGDDTFVDAGGNVIDVKRSEKMGPKEIKKAIKDVEKKLKDHAKNKTSTWTGTTRR